VFKSLLSKKVLKNLLNSRICLKKHCSTQESVWCPAGLEALHELTRSARYELRVDLRLWDGTAAFATYTNVTIASEADSYRLGFLSYTGGTAGRLACRKQADAPTLPGCFLPEARFAQLLFLCCCFFFKYISSHIMSKA
jgi:hypothetical protein